MSAIAVILPALAGALIALQLRERLRALGFLSFMGWALLGAGVPVLAGQLLALGIVGGADAAVGEARAGWVQIALAAGLSGGLGWAAGALSARFTGGAR
ncbi:MAG: hypothetical protein ABL308_06250 [Oceanicaulis sp.]